VTNAVNPSLRNRASFTVRFPLSPIVSKALPKNVRIIQRPMSHDLAVFSLRTPDGLSGIMSGAPVTIDWVNSRGSGLFRGYVYRVDPMYEANAATSVNIICIGSSYPLMNRGQSVWVDVSAPDVVKDVAFMHGLAADVEHHPRIYTQILQAGESYWQLLVRLADETGYVLRFEDSTIVFRSRDSMTQHFRPIAPTMKMVRSGNPGAQLSADILDFKAKIGEYNPELGASRTSTTVSGVDPQTGATITKSVDVAPYRADGAPVFEDYLVHTVVNNQSELEAASQAAQERKRFSRFAKMTTWGEPYLAPERVVNIAGVDPGLTGYWTVRSVTHLIDAAMYKCEVEIGTDGLGGPLSLVGEPDNEVSSRRIPVDPHRLPGLPWPYPAPVLEATTKVVGLAGQPLSDFSWVAPVRKARSA
jgi:phage protein D